MAENKKYVELIWHEKYDKLDLGEKKPIERPNLPFQVVETINKPRRLQKGLGDYEESLKHWPENYPKDWKNLLVWGDNKLVMSSLIKQGWAGKINLIYIDPPFFTGADFTVRTKLGDERIEKEPSIIEERAYKDTWSGGIASYLRYMYERLVLMRELLAENGSIYVHLDWHVGHYVKVMMDEIFGYENCLNHIIWKRYAAHSLSTQRYDTIADHILVYARNAPYVVLKPQLEQLSNEEIEKRFPYIEKETGRRYQHVALEQSSNVSSRGEVRIIQGKKVISDIGWRWTQETFDERLAKNPNLIYWTKEGRPRYKVYADEYQGRPLGDIWEDIQYLSAGNNERIGFDTQKPEALLKRIILASSNPGDIVADFFCGSGTTLAVAEKLGRRWIGCDLSKFAIQVTRKRLLDIHNSKDLTDDKGKKKYDIEKVVVECRANKFNKADVLGWEWSYEVNELAKESAKKNGVDLKLIQIPSVNEIKSALVGFDLKLFKIPEEVVEKALLPHVKFAEVAYLEIETKLRDNEVTLRITDFQIPPTAELAEIASRVKDSRELIDYWAIDWDYKGDTFHNQWQSFRTKKNPKVEYNAKHKYKESGEYQIMVKVVDVFGNDTNKILKVRVR